MESPEPLQIVAEWVVHERRRERNGRCGPVPKPPGQPEEKRP